MVASHYWYPALSYSHNRMEFHRPFQFFTNYSDYLRLFFRVLVRVAKIVTTWNYYRVLFLTLYISRGLAGIRRNREEGGNGPRRFSLSHKFTFHSNNYQQYSEMVNSYRNRQTRPNRCFSMLIQFFLNRKCGI